MIIASCAWRSTPRSTAAFWTRSPSSSKPRPDSKSGRLPVVSPSDGIVILRSPGMTLQPFTHTHSAEETVAYGRSLSAELRPPLLILLRGDLGAGKTTLVKGIAEG